MKEDKKKKGFYIHKKPAKADDYEFIVCRKIDGEFWYWGCYENGFKAEQIARKLGKNAVIFHNLRIQGKRK